MNLPTDWSCKGINNNSYFLLRRWVSYLLNEYMHELAYGDIMQLIMWVIDTRIYVFHILFITLISYSYWLNSWHELALIYLRIKNEISCVAISLLVVVGYWMWVIDTWTDAWTCLRIDHDTNMGSYFLYRYSLVLITGYFISYLLWVWAWPSLRRYHAK